MAGDGVLSVLTEKYPKFTKSERKVADYIFQNKTQPVYMSITNLAEACGVAEATIFRFCKSLGYKGYNEFKMSLAQSAVQPSLDSEIALFGDVLPEDSVQDMCRKVYNANLCALNQTMELFSEKEILQAVDLLSNARNVYCFGQGSSLITAMEAYSRFLSASPNFFCIQDSHLQTMAASIMREDDVILFFSYSGSTRDMMDVLQPASAAGVKIILVTRFTKSPATEFADVVLLCGSNEGPLQMGSVPAKMAQLLIIDVLFNEYCRKDLKRSMKNRGTTSNAISKKLL